LYPLGLLDFYCQKIKWGQMEEFSDHVRLGGFPALSCFISSIGKLWGDGGLSDLLVDSNVYAGATVNQMLDGKQFHRAVRGLTLVYEALNQLLISSFLKWCEEKDHLEKIPNSFWRALYDAQRVLSSGEQSSSLNAVEELEALTLKYVQPLMMEFKRWGSDTFPTFKYWIMLIDAIQIMLLNIRSERDGDWELHLKTTVSMLPYFFCTNKVNYSRYMPAYVLEMLKLPHEIESACKNGEFSIRESSSAFNGIWSDMGTEKNTNPGFQR
jgi:hypothetical protein